jgi:FtsH-binding integral membrane protein
MQTCSVSPSCNAKAMGLVALQLGLLFASITAAKSRPRLLLKASSWQGTLASFLLMIGGIWGLTTRRCEFVSWSCFTAGAIVLGLQLGRYDNAALKKGLAQASILLVAAAVLAPFVGYYSGATGLLLLLTLGLLVGIVGSLVWPSTTLDAVLSAGGSALFAIWTIHDVSARPCDSPWLKSVEVFLDIFNLFAFSVS